MISHTLLFAMKRPPLLIQPGLTPVSSSSRLTCEISSLIRMVSVSLGRRLHTSPAVCQVVPFQMEKTGETLFDSQITKFALNSVRRQISSTDTLGCLKYKVYAASSRVLNQFSLLAVKLSIDRHFSMFICSILFLSGNNHLHTCCQSVFF